MKNTKNVKEIKQAKKEGTSFSADVSKAIIEKLSLKPKETKEVSERRPQSSKGI